MIDVNRAQPFRRNSTADVNAALVNAGRCGLASIVVSNIGGAAAFVKLYDKAGAPTVGTDIPVMTIPIAANGVVPLDLGGAPMPFQLGLGLAITNLAADSDTTAVAAGQVKVAGQYLYP